MIKKILFAIIFLLAFVIAASAATITIPTFTIPNYMRTTAPKIRVYYSATFTASDGTVVAAGNPNGGTIYKVISTTLLNGTVTVPAFTIPSTTDGLDSGISRVSFYLYDGNAPINPNPLAPYMSLLVPPTIASATGCTPAHTCASLAELKNWSAGSPPLPPDTFYNKAQIDAFFAAIALTPGLLSLNGLGASTQLFATGTAGADFNIVSGTATHTFNFPSSSASNRGLLTSADWNTFNAKQAALGFTAENVANKNATNGYAGLSGGKLAVAQGQEVWSVTDLTDYSGASGVGSTAIKATITTPSVNDVLSWNGTNWVNVVPGTGSVSSVGLTLPNIFTVTVSPITSSGSLTAILANQSANVGFFGPTSGGASAPTFRSMVVADLPTVDVAHGGSGLATLSTYALLAGGTTATGNLQQVGGVGTSGQVLTSNGPGALPSFQASTASHNLLAGSPVVPDTTASSPVRGGIITAQGGGSASWTQLALGTSGLPLVSNGSDITYGQITLTTAVSGVLPIANGGTNATSANYNLNGVAYYDNTRIVTTATQASGSTLCLTSTSSGAPVWGSCAGSAATSWSALTSPSADNTVAMSTFKTTFTFGARADTADDFTFQDVTTNTGTGHLLVASTVGASTLKVLMFSAKGTTDGVEMGNDAIFKPIGTGTIIANQLNGASTTAGIQAQTGTPGTFAPRTITAGSNAGISVANGDGASANPTISWAPATQLDSFSLFDGSQASRTVTFDLSGTDPVLTLSSGVFNVSTGTIQQGGTAVALSSVTVTGTSGVSGGGDLTTNRTLSLDQAFSPTWTGIHTFTPTARPSGSASYLTINIPTDTGITASTEAIGFKTVTAKRTWDTTVPATQREFLFAAPTYDSSAGVTTFTTAATVAIDSAPILAGSGNVAIANSVALWVQTGASCFGACGTGGSLDPPHQVGASTVTLGTLKDYGTDNGAGNIFHFSSVSVNAGSRPNVAGLFIARATGASSNAFGGNFGCYSEVTGANCQGLELNFASTATGAPSYGGVITYAGTQNSAGSYLLLNSNNSHTAANGVVISNSGSAPIASAGSLFLATHSGGGSSISVSAGINLADATFTRDALIIPNNAGLTVLRAAGTDHQIFFMDSLDEIIINRGSLVGQGASPVLIGVGQSQALFVQDHNNATLFKITESNGAMTRTTGTASATAGAATLNAPTGTITSEALTTAAGGTYTLTLTNNTINAPSLVGVTFYNGTNTQGRLVLGSVTPGGNSVVIKIENIHATQALNGTIKIAFTVEN